MKINEVLFSNFFPSLNTEYFKNLEYQSFDNVETVEIYKAKDAEHTIFFSKNNDVICGYVIIENEIYKGYHPLVRIENITKQKGLITTIIVSILSHGYKLVITKDEMLSEDVMKWISKLIASGYKGISIKNQNGNSIAANDVKKEWERVRNDFMSYKEENSDLELFIEGPGLNRKKLDEKRNIYRDKNRLIYPGCYYFGAEMFW